MRVARWGDQGVIEFSGLGLLHDWQPYGIIQYVLSPKKVHLCHVQGRVVVIAKLLKFLPHCRVPLRTGEDVRYAKRPARRIRSFEGR